MDYSLNEEDIKAFEEAFNEDKLAWRLELLEWVETIRGAKMTYYGIKRQVKNAFSVIPDNFDHFFERLLDDLQTEGLLEKTR